MWEVIILGVSAYLNWGVNVFSAGHSLCGCVFLQVRDEIERFGIKVYQFPECDSDEEEEFKQMDKELKVRQNTSHYTYIHSAF